MRGNIESYTKYKNVPFNSVNKCMQVSHSSKMTFYQSSEDLDACVEEGRQFLDEDFSNEYIEKARKQCAKHQAFYLELLSADISKLTDAQLLSFWRDLIDNYSHSVAYFRSTQEEPTRFLVQKISSIVTPEEMNILSLSPKLDDINRENDAWQKLIEDGFSRESGLKHLYSFPWLFQNSFSYDETLNELEQRASQTTIRDLIKEKADLSKKQSKILGNYPQITSLVNTLQELALLRTEVKAAWGSTGFYSLPILKEVSRRFGVDFSTLNFFYPSEDIEALIQEVKTLNEKDIDDRKKCTAYVLHNGVLRSYMGDEALEIERKELGEDRNQSVSITELKGASASPGKVTGVIHILEVNDPIAAQKFRKTFNGGILVTSMTQPNIVDIAERADAIITDEGGMLCHAAIISREFGIPCIVGTHKATKVLKDGDVVEVDANTGIIKILNKK
jgi:rifampicin phosphotransferase